MSSTPPEWGQMRPPRRPPRTLWTDLARMWHRFRGLPMAIQVVAVLVVAVLFLVLLTSLFESDPDTRVTSRSPTTRSGVITTVTSTTLPPLPPGDDRTVQTVLDGDSFELTDGAKIRLIGIDAPDVETSDCYSIEATAHLNSLVGGKNVRLVYDVTRTDRLGRVLAYVYRLPDGLFVNVAMARDGFATELTTGANNTASADVIMNAVADARAANRGLWQACQSTTTAARSSTTAAATTTAPTTTTTTAPATTSTTAAPATTSTTRNLEVVRAGDPCLIPGAQAALPDGRVVRCSQEGLFYVWKLA